MLNGANETLELTIWFSFGSKEHLGIAGHASAGQVLGRARDLVYYGREMEGLAGKERQKIQICRFPVRFGRFGELAGRMH